MWSFFSRDPAKDFNFEIGELVPNLEDKSIWSLHKGKKKVELNNYLELPRTFVKCNPFQGVNEEVSVFVFNLKSNSEATLEVAKASVKRLKTLRHPSILTYLDSLESEKVLYLTTEYIDPLKEHLEKLTLENPQKDLYIAWGIFQITVSKEGYTLIFSFTFWFECFVMS